jgi:hypothetical protein
MSATSTIRSKCWRRSGTGRGAGLIPRKAGCSCTVIRLALSLLMANADPSGYSGVSMTGSGAVYHERALQGVKARLADPATGTHSMSPEAARRAVFMGPPWRSRSSIRTVTFPRWWPISATPSLGQTG